jgi:hypothetical protein
MWLTCIEIGFVGFVTSLFATIWWGFSTDGTRRRGLSWGVAEAYIFFALWVVAMLCYPVPYPN